MKTCSSLLASMLLGVSAAGAATIIQTGDALIDRPATDGWAGVFYNGEAIAAPNATETIGTITDVSFYVNVGGRGAMEVVPLLLENDGTNTTVIGIGQTLSGYTVAEVVENAAFTLSSGLGTFDTTKPGSTFHIGFGSWNPDGNTRLDDGLIAYDGTAGAPGQWFAGLEGESIALNTVFAGQVGQEREYSYQNTISFIPEPSAFLLLMGAGFAGIIRRRR